MSWSSEERWSMSTKEDKKEEDERKIFSIFACLTYGQTDVCAVESRKPREPDILYHGKHEITAFEMTNCFEVEFQKDISALDDGKSLRPIGWLDWAHCGEVLTKKLQKKIYNSEHNVELLLYYGRNGLNLAGADDVYVGELARVLEKHLSYGDQVQFRRIWYLGENKSYLLFSSLDERVEQVDPNSGY
jgi:hypothetical protein